MITARTHLNDLKKINPFTDWKQLDRKLTIYKEDKFRCIKKGQRIYRIDFSSIERGNSFWLSSAFLQSLNRKMRRMDLIRHIVPPDAKIKVLKYRENNEHGYRVFCTKPHQLDVIKCKGSMAVAV